MIDENQTIAYILGFFKTFGEKIDKITEELAYIKASLVTTKECEKNRKDCREGIINICKDEANQIGKKEKTNTAWYSLLSFQQIIAYGLVIIMVLVVLMGGAIVGQNILKFALNRT